MTKTVIRLDAKAIDGFALIDRPEQKTCSFRGCRKGRKVRVFWSVPGERNQQRDSVCFEHAVHLANLVLQVRKFGHKKWS